MCPLLPASISKCSMSLGLAGACGGGFLQHQEIPAASFAASQSPGKGCKENSGFQPLPVTRLPRCFALSRVAAPGCPAALNLAQPCQDGHDAAGPVEGVCMAVGERPLQQWARRDFVVTKIDTSCKRSWGGREWGKGSGAVQVATPFSDAALGRAKPPTCETGRKRRMG